MLQLLHFISSVFLIVMVFNFNFDFLVSRFVDTSTKSERFYHGPYSSSFDP